MTTYFCFQATDKQLSDCFADAYDIYMSTAETKKRLPAAIASLKRSLGDLHRIEAERKDVEQ